MTMLFDPMAHYAHLKNMELEHRASADYPAPSVFQMALWGNAQPFAAAIAFDELGKTVNFNGVKRLFRYMFLSDPDPTEVRSHFEDRLGIRVPVSDEAFNEMLAEVKRYKWLEAEKAGRDIWRERNPDDPDSSAMREWFAHHFGAWYLSRVRNSQQPAHLG